eukprot:1728581-Alexandrium_andersonii.AAC.1
MASCLGSVPAPFTPVLALAACWPSASGCQFPHPSCQSGTPVRLTGSLRAAPRHPHSPLKLRRWMPSGC